MSAADPDSETSVVALMAATTVVLVGTYVMIPFLAACWAAGRIRRFRGVWDPERAAEGNGLTTESSYSDDQKFLENNFGFRFAYFSSSRLKRLVR